MEKYSRLSKITNEYLQGTLTNLQMSYSIDDSLLLTFVYEDHNHYWYDYELEINLTSKSINYGYHTSEGNLNKVTLDREPGFEIAVCNELFTLPKAVLN